MNDIVGTGQGRSTPPEGRGCSPYTLGRDCHPCTLFPYIRLALLALLMGLAALALSGTTPFGSHTLCWQDNGQQVASDFGYVRGVWEGRHALDWSYACGGSPRSSFHPTFNNLVSPLTWAVAAIPGLSAVTGLSLLFLLQLALLPLGAFYYLRKTFPRLPVPLGMALALAYAFGGFVQTKYTFLPFLNLAIVFPWYVAALDSLLRRGRWLPYTLLLAFMMAVGTYFAWMYLLFTAVYATARTGWRWRSPLRQHSLCLILASAGALALSTFSWLPSLLVTSASARAGEAHFWWHATRADIEPMFASWLSCIFAPLVLLLLVLKLRLRRNRYALTLLVLLVGLAFTSATTLWHLSRPWDFAGRFAYMADFMLICLVAAALSPFCRGRRPLRWRWLPLVGLSALVLYFCVDCIGFPWELLAAFSGSLALAACWRWRCVASLGVGVMAALATLMLWMSLDWNKHRRDYQAAPDRIWAAEWAAQQLPAAEGRAKSQGHAAVENLAFFTPFDSLSHFTACITAEQEETLARWGYQKRTAVISTEGGTAASDTLLGMRYILSHEEDAPYRVEENPYYFGLGLMVPAGFLSDLPKGADPIARHQAMLTHLLGAEHAGTRSPANELTALHPLCDGEHYLQQPSDGGRCLCVEHSYSRWGVVETLPRLAPITPRSVVQHSDLREEAFVYHLPPASLKALKRYALELPVQSEYAGYCMRLHCRSTEERYMLFLPLLWQDGYEAAVDGCSADVYDLGGFVGIPMRAPGEHVVELEYRGWGGKSKWAGTLLTLASLPLLLGAWAVSRCVRAPRCLDTLCRRLLLGVSWLLLLWPLLTLPLGLWWR